MNKDEATLFMAAMTALKVNDNDGTASKGLIEAAEPMEATCEVKTTE